jgi:hypothetical protein
MTMSNLFSPVAEYRGIALIERHGNKGAAWLGKDYKTDGRTYLFTWAEEEQVATFGLPNERAAKEFIDSLRDCPEEITGEDGQQDALLTGGRYLNFKEAYLLLAKKPWTGEIPSWLWDEGAGVFVRPEEQFKAVVKW